MSQLSPSQIEAEGRAANQAGAERAAKPHPQASSEHELWDIGRCKVEEVEDAASDA